MPTLNAGKKALFLDRDGIVNRRLIDDYVKNWGEFEFLDDIFTVLPEAHARGFVPIVISNQRGIGRGLMSQGDLSRIHERMQLELRSRTGTAFQAVYYCPHDLDEGCACRKPQPGMILRAADEIGIRLQDSWLIGDSETDVQAGRAAGVKTAHVTATPDESLARLSGGTLEEVWTKMKLH